MRRVAKWTQGFVYATDALAQKDKVKIVLLVSTATPIRYPVAAVSGSRSEGEARKFIDYLLSPAGQTVLARHGFRKP